MTNKYAEGLPGKRYYDGCENIDEMQNFLGEVLPLTQVPSTGTRPPTGMGDCCAPKLLQCAVRHRLEPLGMIEFWWGSPPPALPRVEGAYYGSCEHKCYPILGFLLRGCAAAEVHP